MVYYKYTFHLISKSVSIDVDTLNEILISFLSDNSFESFECVDNDVVAYISAKDDKHIVVSDILALYPIDGIKYQYSKEMMPDIDWNEEWEKYYFSPQSFAGGRCVIRAPFHPTSEDAQIELLISPKMAFGTGNHQTTALIVEYLLDLDLKGMTVLDMGCGTGVLGLLSKLCGAERVVCVDIDQWAYFNVIENAKLNHIDINEVILGDATHIKGKGAFDLIIANITRNILIADMDKYVGEMIKGSRIVFSGFYDEDVRVIQEKGFSLGLVSGVVITKDKWALVEMIL